MSLRDMIDFTTVGCRKTKSTSDNHFSNLLIDWNHLEEVRKGNNTKSIRVNVEEVCRDKNEETTLIISIKQNYSNAKHVCNQIGGTFYNPKNKADIANLPSNLLKNNHIEEKNITDLTLHCGNLFWIPVTLRGNEQPDGMLHFSC